jgi:hypothetical protein
MVQWQLGKVPCQWAAVQRDGDESVYKEVCQILRDFEVSCAVSRPWVSIRGAEQLAAVLHPCAGRGASASPVQRAVWSQRLGGPCCARGLRLLCTTPVQERMRESLDSWPWLPGPLVRPRPGRFEWRGLSFMVISLTRGRRHWWVGDGIRPRSPGRWRRRWAAPALRMVAGSTWRGFYGVRPVRYRFDHLSIVKGPFWGGRRSVQKMAPNFAYMWRRPGWTNRVILSRSLGSVLHLRLLRDPLRRGTSSGRKYPFYPLISYVFTFPKHLHRFLWVEARQVPVWTHLENRQGAVLGGRRGAMDGQIEAKLCRHVDKG